MANLLDALLYGEEGTKTFPGNASPASPSSPQPAEPERLETMETVSGEKFSTVAPWPPESVASERGFGVPHARLHPYIGRKVRTPEGPGTLLQVFSDRCAVLLAPEAEKCRFFAPAEIEPVSPEVLG